MLEAVEVSTRGPKLASNDRARNRLVLDAEDKPCVVLPLQIGLVAQRREIPTEFVEVETTLGFLELDPLGFRREREELGQLDTKLRFVEEHDGWTDVTRLLTVSHRPTKHLAGRYHDIRSESRNEGFGESRSTWEDTRLGLTPDRTMTIVRNSPRAKDSTATFGYNH